MSKVLKSYSCGTKLQKTLPKYTREEVSRPVRPQLVAPPPMRIVTELPTTARLRPRAGRRPPLRVPEGMSVPDRSAALEVPPEKPGAAKPDDTGCLAEAPSYFRSSGTVARSPEEVIASWAQAWANREAEGVLTLYSAGFVAPTDSAGSAAWLEQRRGSGDVSIEQARDPEAQRGRAQHDRPRRRLRLR